MLGFVSAMMAHGTAGVVASGVPLPDGTCITAMPDLHREIHQGAPLARALHRARATICAAADPADYVAWCGLTAYGAG
jgi:CHAT domain